jgi:sugar phosphate permease
LFTPSIIKALGYTNANANLLSVPPYAVAFFASLLIAWWSDRILQRGVFIVGCMLVCMVGYVIQLTDVSAAIKYFGIFLCIGGVSPCVSTCISWVGNK